MYGIYSQQVLPCDAAPPSTYGISILTSSPHLPHLTSSSPHPSRGTDKKTSVPATPWLCYLSVWCFHRTISPLLPRTFRLPALDNGSRMAWSSLVRNCNPHSCLVLLCFAPDVANQEPRLFTKLRCLWSTLGIQLLCANESGLGEAEPSNRTGCSE